jgi:hypothetical protein
VPAQFARQLPDALACPPQRRHRVAPRRRFHQRLECLHQLRVFLRTRLAPSALATYAPHRRSVRHALKFANAPSDSVPRQSRGFGHGAHATPSQRNRLDGRPPATRTFVEFRVKRFELRSNPFDDQSILHAPFMTRKGKTIKLNCSSYFRTAPKFRFRTFLGYRSRIR